MESRLTVLSGRVGWVEDSSKIEETSERTRGQGQECGDCGGGWRWKRVWGINGNGKNTIKVNC